MGYLTYPSFNKKDCYLEKGSLGLGLYLTLGLWGISWQEEERNFEDQPSSSTTLVDDGQTKGQNCNKKVSELHENVWWETPRRAVQPQQRMTMWRKFLTFVKQYARSWTAWPSTHQLIASLFTIFGYTVFDFLRFEQAYLTFLTWRGTWNTAGTLQWKGDSVTKFEDPSDPFVH